MTGDFVISLEFELLWGVRDHADRHSYGRNILGGREAIPRMVDHFARHGVVATWATVGFMFCEPSRSSWRACRPRTCARPTKPGPVKLRLPSRSRSVGSSLSRRQRPRPILCRC